MGLRPGQACTYVGVGALLSDACKGGPERGQYHPNSWITSIMHEMSVLGLVVYVWRLMKVSADVTVTDRHRIACRG